MKIYILTFLSALILTFSGSSLLAQNGEIDRFKDTSLERKINEVRMFPNPTADYLSVKINNSTLEEASFTVHNIIGNVVDVPVEIMGKNEYRFRVKDLAPGYYLLAIRDDQGYFKETYKFLKR
ncbi:T9SS type A sorting domain-containing protein [Fulvivirga sp. 29W222]|uniref:T9SS type A sorting domain-containing protein n=1 Tax=Fulvivirga marina TaxID=2494733 RepID=A0A937FYI2_9BACT|nr:T9SS type A sorting domain-containing protein [Fulvivirga marina]MBL6447132.1 T9SS type A sorting domain-containing protein [Fulvivirga marina]